MCHLTQVGSDGPAVCQLASLGPSRVQWHCHTATLALNCSAVGRQAMVLVYNPPTVFSKKPWRTHSLLVHVSNNDHGQAFGVRVAITEIFLTSLGFFAEKF